MELIRKCLICLALVNYNVTGINALLESLTKTD